MRRLLGWLFLKRWGQRVLAALLSLGTFVALLTWLEPIPKLVGPARLTNNCSMEFSPQSDVLYVQPYLAMPTGPAAIGLTALATAKGEEITLPPLMASQAFTLGKELVAFRPHDSASFRVCRRATGETLLDVADEDQGFSYPCLILDDQYVITRNLEPQSTDVWELSRSQLLHRLPLGNLEGALAAGGLLLSTEGRTATLWDLRTGQVVRRLEMPSAVKAGRMCQFTADGRQFLVWNRPRYGEQFNHWPAEHRLEIWRTQPVELMGEIRTTYDFRYLPEAHEIVELVEDRNDAAVLMLRRWDVNTVRIIEERPVPFFVPDRDYRLQAVHGLKHVSIQERYRVEAHWVTRHFGKYLTLPRWLQAHTITNIHVMDIREGTVVTTPGDSLSPVVSPDGRFLACCHKRGDDKEFRLYDLPPPRPWGWIIAAAALPWVLAFGWQGLSSRRHKTLSA